VVPELIEGLSDQLNSESLRHVVPELVEGLGDLLAVEPRIIEVGIRDYMVDN
jgi:hypothetical protein